MGQVDEPALSSSFANGETPTVGLVDEGLVVLVPGAPGVYPAK